MAPKYGGTNTHGQIGPPLQQPTEEVARVAPKSGGTDMHGQVGPPK